MSLATFASQALANLQTTAAIVPSSRYLGRAMVEPLRWKNAKVVVELGPGTGVMTRELLSLLPPDATLLAFEISPSFVDYLRETIVDDRLHLVQAGAETAPDELRKLGIEHVDGIVSSLGITLMDEQVIDAIFRGLVPFLDESSTVTQFQYGSRVRLEEGRPVYFNVRALLDRYFKTVDSTIVWRNIPPAVVFECVGANDLVDTQTVPSNPLSLYSRAVANPVDSKLP